MNCFFVLTEKIGVESDQTLIFPKDRDVITFGRSSLCEYRILPNLPGQNELPTISRIQATLELTDGRWVLKRGCTDRSKRGDIAIGISKSPFWLEESKITATELPLSIGSSFYLYRDDEASCLLTCVNEESYAELVADRPLDPDDTRPYDLLGEIMQKIESLEQVLSNGLTSIESLYQNDRQQAKRFDRQEVTNIKFCCALILIAFAALGGAQLFDPAQRRDLLYDFVRSVVAIATGGGGVFLLKDSLNRRSSNK